MDDENRDELLSFLKAVPAVEFCCVYGSTLHPSTNNKSIMVDYIFGVPDPLQWHAEITEVADEIGVGVHFNPFVSWNGKMVKYGVVRMHDLIQDVLKWEKFYLSGRLQKPVVRLVDNLDILGANSVNLKAAISAAFLLLPQQFSEEDLYGKVCSLSYMGDLRMLFAEDKNKVKKIVQGQFDLFHSMYKPYIEEFEGKDYLRCLSSKSSQLSMLQDCDLSATSGLVSSLPRGVQMQMGLKLGENKVISDSGKVLQEATIKSRKEAADCLRKVLRRRVMVSSGRQAVSGLLTSGGTKSVRYLETKCSKHGDPGNDSEHLCFSHVWNLHCLPLPGQERPDKLTLKDQHD